MPALFISLNITEVEKGLFLFLALFLFCLSRRILRSVISEILVGLGGLHFEVHIIGIIKMNTARKSS